MIEYEETRWQRFCKGSIKVWAMRMDVPFRVETEKGWAQGKPGDWLLLSDEGDQHPCLDNIFRKTYEREL